MLTEQWSFVKSLYFCMVTLTTVGMQALGCRTASCRWEALLIPVCCAGYGDVTPNSTAGRVIVCFYALASLGMATVVLGELGDWMIRQVEERLKRQQRLIRKRQRQQTLNLVVDSSTVDGILRKIETLTIHDKKRIKAAVDEQLSRLERLRSAGATINASTSVDANKSVTLNNRDATM
jgi:heme exporter protein D